MNAQHTSTAYKIFTNIAFWVILAIILGTLLGLYYPSTAVKMNILSEYFISIIKIFVGPIIFLTLTTGISGMGDLKKVGRVGIKALIYFEIVSIIALAIGILMAHFLQPGDVDLSKLHGVDYSKYTKQTEETKVDFWHLLKTNFTIQVLIVSIIVGIIINKLPQKGS